MFKSEIEVFIEEFKGKVIDLLRVYLNNFIVWNYYEYIVFLMVVYEFEYFCFNKINVYYVFEKLVVCFGIIFVMIMIF